MRAWTTRYWQTMGIECFDDYVESKNGACYLVRGRGYSDPGYRFDRVGTDVFLTEEDAKDDVRKKAERKIVSLTKKIERVRGILEELNGA